VARELFFEKVTLNIKRPAYLLVEAHAIKAKTLTFTTSFHPFLLPKYSVLFVCLWGAEDENQGLGHDTPIFFKLAVLLKENSQYPFC
jgi:hypothetical protein